MGKDWDIRLSDGSGSKTVDPGCVESIFVAMGGSATFGLG